MSGPTDKRRRHRRDPLPPGPLQALGLELDALRRAHPVATAIGATAILAGLVALAYLVLEVWP